MHGAPAKLCGAYHQKTGLTTRGQFGTLRRNDKHSQFPGIPSVYRKEYGSMSTDKRTCAGSLRRPTHAVM